MQNADNMKITKQELAKILEYDIESKVEIMQCFADEFMTIKEYHETTKMPMRTIYDKLGTPEVKGFKFCGLRILHF